MKTIYSRNNACPARLLVSCTTHGDGERLALLKRTLENLNWQSFSDFRLVIVIDNSPAEVCEKIKGLAHDLVDQCVVVLNDGSAQGYSKRLHMAALDEAQNCGAEYLVFIDDDNFVSKENYSRLVRVLDENPYLDFACCSWMTVADGKFHGRVKFSEVDWGCCMYRASMAPALSEALSSAPNLYHADWLIIKSLVERGFHYEVIPEIGHFWARGFKGDWREIVALRGDRVPPGGNRKEPTAVKFVWQENPRTNLAGTPGVLELVPARETQTFPVLTWCEVDKDPILQFEREVKVVFLNKENVSCPKKK